jgi:UDP-N-acetylglucosamine 2-epimerase (non-hydrolysing)
MPEEHNRVLTDHLSDLLFTPSPDANINLHREGIPAERIRFVGNVMIDSLVALLPLTYERAVLRELGLWGSVERPDDYVLVTLHRPSNVDNPRRLHRLLEALSSIATKQPVVFPVHPRTSQQLRRELHPGLKFTKPLGYLDFLALERYARVVVTDSGGVQEETTFLGVPCLTVRANTERPVTVLQGTNRLVGHDPTAIVGAIERILTDEREPMPQAPPDLWDGRASDRIVRAVAEASGIPASHVRFGPAPPTALELGEAPN